MVGTPEIFKDVLKETLLCLPVKSLLRFRCVSKFSCTLIKNPVFINSHLLKQRRNDTMLLVRRHLPPPDYYDTFSFHDLNSLELEGLLPNLSIPFLWDIENREYFNPRSVKLLGPCNGIVCIVYEDMVILSNPALREFRRLPSCPFPSHMDIRKMPLGRGFGCTCTNTFKVVLINQLRSANFGTDEKCFMIHLYDSINNCWREINNNSITMPYIFSFRSSDLFFKGCCHWNGQTSGETTPDVILTFDVNSELFEQFEHPSGFKLGNGLLHCLIVLNECLASVRYEVAPCRVEVWVMKEYGIKESWTKQYVIGPYQIMCPFFIWRNDEQLLAEHGNGELTSLGLHTDDIKTFPVCGIDGTLWAKHYKESLISFKSAN